MATKGARLLLLASILVLAISTPVLASSHLAGGVQTALDFFFDFLGPQGFNFLITFILIFAVSYMALSRIPQFETTSGTAGGVSIFCFAAAFATSYYVYSRNIDIVGFLAPFFLVVLAIMLGLIALWLGLSARHGDLTGAHWGIAAGLIMMVVGFSIVFLWPDGVMWGMLLAIVGFITLVLVGIAYVSKYVINREGNKLRKEADATSKESQDARNVGNAERRTEELERRVINDYGQFIQAIAQAMATGRSTTPAINIVNNLERDTERLERAIIREREETQRFIQDALRIEREATNKNFQDLGHFMQQRIAQLEQVEIANAQALERIELVQTDLVQRLDALAKQASYLIKHGAKADQIRAIEQQMRDIITKIAEEGKLTRSAVEKMLQQINISGGDIKNLAKKTALLEKIEKEIKKLELTEFKNIEKLRDYIKHQEKTITRPITGKINRGEKISGGEEQKLRYAETRLAAAERVLEVMTKEQNPRKQAEELVQVSQFIEDISRITVTISGVKPGDYVRKLRAALPQLRVLLQELEQLER